MSEQIRSIPFEFEPKRVNRFTAEFPTELGIEVWKVQKFTRPKANINSVEIPFMNEYQYVAGKYKWEPVTITFIDTIGPSTSQEVMEWFRLHAESMTGKMGYAAGYMKNIILKSTDPNGVEIDKWFLERCFITKIDFGENDYGNDELTMITVEVQPQRCIHNM